MKSSTPTRSRMQRRKSRLIKKFKLSDKQAQAILDMQLRRLAALERQKIEEEHKELLKLIEFLESLLADPKKILGVIRDELKELSKNYSDARRTRIAANVSEDFSDEDLVQDEALLVSITQRGYIRLVTPQTYRTLRGGARGSARYTTREEDEVVRIMAARSHDRLLFFNDRVKLRNPHLSNTDSGVWAKAYRCIHIDLSENEKVTAVWQYRSDQRRFAPWLL